MNAAYGRFSRRTLLVGAITLLAGKALGNDGQSFRSLRKAVWVWHTEPEVWPALNSLCLAQRIDHIMLSLSKNARSSLLEGDTTVKAQLRSLKTGDLSLWALLGEQDWVTSKKASLPNSLLDVLQIQRQDALFDGLEFDIEPHLLPQWRAGDRVTVARKYLDLLSRIRAGTNRSDVAVTAVPSYTEVTLDDGNSLLWHVARAADRVSLMAYRDTPGAALEYARSSIEVFNAAKRPWHLGVLVDQSKESHVSYFGTAADEFKKDMVELDRLVRSESPGGYLGLIFEDYAALNAELS